MANFFFALMHARKEQVVFCFRLIMWCAMSLENKKKMRGTMPPMTWN